MTAMHPTLRCSEHGRLSKKWGERWVMSGDKKRGKRGGVE